MFVFWAWVSGGWRAAAGTLGTFAVIAAILLLMAAYVPGINPGFVLVPVLLIPIVIMWRRERRSS